MRGGPDNITAVVAKVLSVPPEESAEEPAAVEPAASPKVHPGVWGVMALCVIVAISLAALQFYMAALVSGLVAAAMAVVGAGAIDQRIGGARNIRPIGQPAGQRPARLRTIVRRTANPWPCSARWLSNFARRPRKSIGRSTGRGSTRFGEQAHAALTKGDFRRRFANTPWRYLS